MLQKTRGKKRQIVGIFTALFVAGAAHAEDSSIFSSALTSSLSDDYFSTESHTGVLDTSTFMVETMMARVSSLTEEITGYTDQVSEINDDLATLDSVDSVLAAAAEGDEDISLSTVTFVDPINGNEMALSEWMESNGIDSPVSDGSDTVSSEDIASIRDSIQIYSTQLSSDSASIMAKLQSATNSYNTSISALSSLTNHHSTIINTITSKISN